MANGEVTIHGATANPKQTIEQALENRSIHTTILSGTFDF